MPPGAIERQHTMRTRTDRPADLGQMQVHRFGVDERQHEPGADAAFWADRTEQIGPSVSLITRRSRAAALVSPDVGQATLLADTGFILPPELDRFTACMLRDGSGDQCGKVFLCAAWASTSCSG